MVNALLGEKKNVKEEQEKTLLFKKLFCASTMMHKNVLFSWHKSHNQLRGKGGIPDCCCCAVWSSCHGPCASCKQEGMSFSNSNDSTITAVQTFRSKSQVLMGTRRKQTKLSIKFLWVMRNMLSLCIRDSQEWQNDFVSPRGMIFTLLMFSIQAQ